MFLRLWREVAPNAAAWLPLALLLSMPVTSRVLRNYPLDALVALFGLVAVWGAWRSLRHAKYLLVVIVACVVGVLIKGPVALFPIGAPACFSVLMQGDWRRGFIQSVVVTLGVAGLLGLVLLDADALLALQSYFSSQVLASISGVRPAEHGRSYLLLRLGLNLGVVGLLVALAALLGKYKRSLPLSREFWCFVLIGVSACLPLLISPRLYRHYLMPGMPYFAIAAAMLLNVPKPTLRWPLLWGGVFVLTVALARGAWVFAQPGKDAQVLADAALITRTLGAQQSPASAVDFCHAELRLQTYLARHHQIRSSVLRSRQGSRVYRVCPGQPTQEGFNPLVSLSGSLFLWGRLDAKGSAN